MKTHFNVANGFEDNSPEEIQKNAKKIMIIDV
jgi:hypothetical protein